MSGRDSYSQQPRLAGEEDLGEGESRHSVAGERKGFWRGFVMGLCNRPMESLLPLQPAQGADEIVVRCAAELESVRDCFDYSSLRR
jgi:hypothetical protein